MRNQNAPFLTHCQLPPVEQIESQVRLALAEDLGAGDCTAKLVPAESFARAELITREQAVLCGCTWFTTIFQILDPKILINWEFADGDWIQPGQLICNLSGSSRALLTGERTALNYLQTLSGTATRARSFAAAVADLPVRIFDTRKTLPHLRAAQKYAVSCGGCYNQRFGLFDAILIKENHLLALGSISTAFALAQNQANSGSLPIQIEVESLQELTEALQAGARLILLDNFSLDDLAQAVALTAGRAELEASGGVTLANIRAIAETGVKRISIGGLTKDLTAIDFSLRFYPV